MNNWCFVSDCQEAESEQNAWKTGSQHHEGSSDAEGMLENIVSREIMGRNTQWSHNDAMVSVFVQEATASQEDNLVQQRQQQQQDTERRRLELLEDEVDMAAKHINSMNNTQQDMYGVWTTWIQLKSSLNVTSRAINA